MIDPLTRKFEEAFFLKKIIYGVLIKVSLMRLGIQLMLVRRFGDRQWSTKE